MPAEVRLWLDARAPAPEFIDSWRESLLEIADEIAWRTVVKIEVAVASRSAGVTFDQATRRRLLDHSRRLHASALEVTCFAGHAGVIAERLPAGMVLVRNPSGVSHSPREDVALDDAATAANVVVSTLENLG